MSSEQTTDNSKPGEKRLIVDVRDSAERKRLEDELAQEKEKTRMLTEMAADEKQGREAVEARAALEAFEREKSDLKQKFSSVPNASSMIDLAPTPDSLFDLQQKLQGMKRAPAGKSTSVEWGSHQGGSGETFEDARDMIDELYKSAYDPEKRRADPQKAAESKRKIDELFESMITGPSWRQLKEPGRMRELTKHSFSSCQQCGSTLMDGEIGEPCRKCGYNPKTSKKTFTFESGMTKVKTEGP